jgi:hypothetical protein
MLLEIPGNPLDANDPGKGISSGLVPEPVSAGTSSRWYGMTKTVRFHYPK